MKPFYFFIFLVLITSIVYADPIVSTNGSVGVTLTDTTPVDNSVPTVTGSSSHSSPGCNVIMLGLNETSGLCMEYTNCNFTQGLLRVKECPIENITIINETIINSNLTIKGETYDLNNLVPLNDYVKVNDTNENSETFKSNVTGTISVRFEEDSSIDWERLLILLIVVSCMSYVYYRNLKNKQKQTKVQMQRTPIEIAKELIDRGYSEEYVEKVYEELIKKQ